MPKYMRAQRKSIDSFDRLQRKLDEEAAAAQGMTTEEYLSKFDSEQDEEGNFMPRSVEDEIRSSYDLHQEKLMNSYEPVLYQIIKDPKELADKESFS